MPPLPRAGGSFAPPMTEEKLRRYERLIDRLDKRSALYDALRVLIILVRLWWNLPESKGPRTRHPLHGAPMTPLDKDIQDQLWEHIPWKHELDGYSAIFEGIDNRKDKELRDCAHHLLWFGRELDMDREPMTMDTLGIPVAEETNTDAR